MVAPSELAGLDQEPHSAADKGYGGCSVSACMSSTGVSREEFNELRLLLVRTTEELRDLAAAYGELEQRHQELVEDVAARFGALQIGPVQASTGASSSAATAALAGLSLAPHRISACESIGAWIRRCLAGEVRGKSGRERIELPSRYYLLIRDKDNTLWDPPKVFKTWTEAKPVVYLRGVPPSCSIYVGRLAFAVKPQGLRFLLPCSRNAF